MDVLTPEQRHFNMSRIHSKNTRPELTVRKWLWNNGYRFRLHRKDLPGNPDIVLSKHNAVIFVHGCFWHRHNCKYASTPATRKEFWEEKLNGNIERDKRNLQKLADLNWRVLVVWECEIKKWNSDLEIKIENFLQSSLDVNKNITGDIYDTEDDYQDDFQFVAEKEGKYDTE
jgi:DNA mismatch endonuclease (patch repair protein)